MAHDTIARTDELETQVDTERRERSQPTPRALHRLRIRWAAIGAAIAVSLGAGGFGLVSATVSSGERLTYVSITSCRLVDLRPQSNVGPRTSPLGPDETFTITAHGSSGNCSGIPTDAVALTTNITALNATAPTFLTVWPANAGRPNASSLNPVPGQPPTPNAVTTRLSPTGQFNVFNRAGSVDVLIDVTGYYVDHDHDDRYDTSAEVDAKIASAIETNLATPAIGPQVFDVGPYAMFEATGTPWDLNGIISAWIKSAGAGCLQSPDLDVVPGQTAERVAATVRNSGSSDVEIDISIVSIDTRPGPTNFLLRGVFVLFEQNVVVPPSNEYIEVSTTSLSSGQDRVLDPGRAHSIRVCSDDPLFLAGMRATFGNP